MGHAPEVSPKWMFNELSMTSISVAFEVRFKTFKAQLPHININPMKSAVVLSTVWHKQCATVSNSANDRFNVYYIGSKQSV